MYAGFTVSSSFLEARVHAEVGHKFISDDVVGALLSDPWERGDESLGGLGRGRVVDAVRA